MKSAQTNCFLGHLRRFVATHTIVMSCVGLAHAATFTWDGAATGNWNTTDSNWTGSIWANAATNDAVFGDVGVGTVTLSEPITANALTFTSAGYSLVGTAPNLLTLGGTAPTLTAQADATIAAIITGTSGLTKAGAGTLTVSGANSYSGGSTVSAGILSIANVSGLGTGSLAFSGGTLSLGYLSPTPAITNALNVAPGQTGTFDVTGSGAASNTLTVTTGAITIDGTLRVTRAAGQTGNTNFAAAVAGAGTLEIGNTQAGVTLSSAAQGRCQFTNASAFTGFTGAFHVLGANGGGNFCLFNAIQTTTNQNLTIDAGGYVSLIASLATPVTTSFGGLNGSGTVARNSAVNSIATLSIGNGNANGSFNGTILGNNLAEPIGGQGIMALTKVGSGTQTLTYANLLYTGATTVSGGALALPVPLASKVFSVADGATLNLTGAPGASLNATTLTLGTSGATALGIGNFGSSPTAAPLNVSGTFTAAGTCTLNVSGGFGGTGTYPLISYGSLGTSPGSFDALALTLPSQVSGSLQNNPSNKTVDLLVTAVNAVTWKGDLAGGLWDLNNTPNWFVNTPFAPDGKYQDNLMVRFDDSATATAVTIDSLVSPSNVTVNNPTKPYTMAGSGGIGGTGGLLKLGAGTLTLTTANFFTGGTTIAGGTLQLGDGTTAGSLNSAIVNHATLAVINGGDQALANPISGSGNLTKLGAGTLTLTGGNSYTGGTAIHDGTLRIGNGTTNGTLSGAYAIASGKTLLLQFNSAGGVALAWANYSGAGTLQLKTAKSGDFSWGAAALPATFTGTLQIDGGRVQASGSGDQGMGGTTAVVVNPGGQFGAWVGGTISQNLTLAGSGYGESGYEGAIRLGNAGVTTILAGSVTLNGNTTVGAVGTGIFSNGITETTPSNLTVGTGTMSGTIELRGANAYTGTTTIAKGTLAITGTGTLGSGVYAGDITANSGTFLNYASTANQLFSGILSGSGALTKSNTGTLTLSGANFFAGTTTVTGGTLVISGAAASTSATSVIGATLKLDYATEDNSKLDDFTVLSLGGGSTTSTLDLTGGTHVEEVASTTLNSGPSSVTRSSGAAVLRMNTINRSAGATINFGADGIASTDNLNNSAGILGAWATIAGGWAVNSTNGADGLITAFTGYADVTRLSSGAKVIADAEASNVRISEGTGSPASITLAAPLTTINTLFQSITDGSGAATIDLTAQTLRLGAAGGILAEAGAGALTLGSAPNSGTLSAGGTLNNAGDIAVTNNSSNPITIHSVIANNGNGIVTLTKAGSGLLTLTGNNTYTGDTTVGIGTVAYGADDVTANAAKLVVSGGTLELGSYSDTVAGVKLTSGSITGSGTLISTTAFDLQSGSVSTVLGGTTGIAKSTAGTVTLTAANTATGSTTLSGGTLALSGGDNRLAAAATVAFSGSSTLALGGTSQTLANLTVATASANGTVTGSGGTLRLGASDFKTGTTAGTANLNLAGLSTFIFDRSAGTFNAGGCTTANASNTLSLAQASAVSAANFYIGNDANTALSKTVSVNMGATTVLNSNTLWIGCYTQHGNLRYASATATPSLTLRGALGGSTRVNDMRVGRNSAGNLISIGTVDLATNATGGSTLDAMINTLYVGINDRGSNGNATMGVRGLFTMGGGTLDATTITLGKITTGSTQGAASTVQGTLTTSGVVKVASLYFGDSDATATNFTVTSTFNLNSGATLYAQTLAKGLGTGTGGTWNRVFNWNDGTIKNYDASTDLTISGLSTFVLAGSGLHAFDIASGRSGTVNQILSGAGALTKLGDGTLTLTAINTYTGDTTVNAGVLAVGGSSIADTNKLVINGGKLAPTGTEKVNSLYFGSTLQASGTWGASGSGADHIDDTHFTGSGKLEALTGASNTYATWISGFTFASGADQTPTGDPDHDGISNGVEMVLGGNPATGMDTALLPTLELVTNPGGTVPDGSYLLFTYRRTALSAGAGVTAACETHTTLSGPWTTVTNVLPNVILTDVSYPWTNPPATNTDRVRVYVPRGASPAHFGRLNANIP